MAVAVGSTKLQLFIRGEKLKDMDTFSKSDTYAVLFSGANGGPAVGRTETKKDELNPQFEKTIDVEFVFETKQEFTIKLFDDDGKGMGTGDEVVGQAKFELARVVGSRDSTLKVPLAPSGTVYITAKEQSKAGRDTVVLKFRGKALKNMDFLGKSDPFYKLERVLPNGQTKLMYQTKAIDNTLDPQWPAQHALRVADLTTGDMNEKTIRFACFDEDIGGTCDDMGWFFASFYDLMNAQQKRQPFVLKDAQGKAYGEIFVDECAIAHFPTFIEYLRGGLQMNLAVSVDFTGSNGNPRDPKSLHYMDPQAPNQYMRAMMGVGDVLMAYDTDKMIPAFGFGGQEPHPSMMTSHFFNLNGQANPYVPGVQGLLDSYAQALQHYGLSGPTNFAPTINGVREIAEASANTYTILLILTDGEITDMEATLKAIVACDRVPMSVIIVGVGNGCDFEMMDQLDGDGKRLCAGGRTMSRDVVQFVPFRKFERAPASALAAEVLREVPEQVVDWAINVGRPANGPAPPPQ